MNLTLIRTLFITAVSLSCQLSAIAAPAQSAACPGNHLHMGHSAMPANEKQAMTHGHNHATMQFADDQCSSCHGAQGVSIADDVPNLAGQEAMYLCGWLAGCRQQGKSCASHEDIAAELTDQQLLELADFYAHLPADNW